VQDYKEFLEDMLKPEHKNATPFITDYKEYHTGGVWVVAAWCGWADGWQCVPCANVWGERTGYRARR
jgi:hypothetical protein